MAYVERRERLGADGRLLKSYRVPWRGPDGRERNKTFKRKVEADRFCAVVSADLVRDQYVDPDAGKVLFEIYARKWLETQTFEESTREAVELRLRLHAFTHLGNRFLSDIQPSTIQGWLRTLSDLAPTYRKVIFANVSTIFTAAIDDELIHEEPLQGTAGTETEVGPAEARPLGERTRPPHPRRTAGPLQADRVAGRRSRLRQGEIFGLSPDDIDLERGEVHVPRQVKLFGGNTQVFGLPKGRKVRKVPLPDGVLDAINAHMTLYPPVEVTLPWNERGGKDTTVAVLLYSREKNALNRNYVNTFWKPALKRAGVEVTRENGCHALRHFYASTALHEGETIKALSEYLGHADPGFTLRTYTHLTEGSAERTKRAIDTVFLGPKAVESDDE